MDAKGDLARRLEALGHSPASPWRYLPPWGLWCFQATLPSPEVALSPPIVASRCGLHR